MDCEKCPQEIRLQNLEKDVANLDAQNQKTHKEFFDRFERMNERVVGYEKDMSYLKSTVADISRDVKEIKEKPGKRWDTVAVCVLTSVIGAVIGFLLNGVLPL